MSGELVEWLRAQIDADEEHWRNVSLVGPLSIWVDEEHDCISFEVNSVKAYRRVWGIRHAEPKIEWGWNVNEAAVEVHSFDRAKQALREVAAGRKLIAVYEEAKAYYEVHRSAPAGELEGLYTAIKLRAEVYAERPGYRKEWEPA